MPLANNRWQPWCWLALLLMAPPLFTEKYGVQWWVPTPKAKAGDGGGGGGKSEMDGKSNPGGGARAARAQRLKCLCFVAAGCTLARLALAPTFSPSGPERGHEGDTKEPACGVTSSGAFAFYLVWCLVLNVRLTHLVARSRLFFLVSFHILRAHAELNCQNYLPSAWPYFAPHQFIVCCFTVNYRANGARRCGAGDQHVWLRAQGRRVGPPLPRGRRSPRGRARPRAPGGARGSGARKFKGRRSLRGRDFVVVVVSVVAAERRGDGGSLPRAGSRAGLDRHVNTDTRIQQKRG